MVATKKREAENYVHYAAINQALKKEGLLIALIEQPDDFEDVPKLLRDKINAIMPQGSLWGEGRIKEFLCNKATSNMTMAMLDEIDPQREVLEWFKTIREMTHASD